MPIASMHRFARGGSLALALGLVTVVAGCTVSVSTKPFFKRNVSLTSTGAWSGQKVTVLVANGQLSVVGDGGDKITVDAELVANAQDKAHESDANLVLDEIQKGLTIDESAGTFAITCPQSQTHYTSDGPLSACNLTVHVPPGSSTVPSNLYATASNGTVTVATLTGTAIVHSANGDASLAVHPTVGCAIESSTENGTATLALPAGFSANQVLISHTSTGTLKSDFPDVNEGTTTYGTVNTGASSVVLKSDNGDVVLRRL